MTKKLKKLTTKKVNDVEIGPPIGPNKGIYTDTLKTGIVVVVVIIDIVGGPGGGFGGPGSGFLRGPGSGFSDSKSSGKPLLLLRLNKPPPGPRKPPPGPPTMSIITATTIIPGFRVR